MGYFRNTFVEKLNWLDDKEYGQIVALSQFFCQDQALAKLALR
ncbi:hypothetical protein QW180_05825 [Vibrio sinaloensis]|nr:hypothetical protein [Vibrio sinaloensis]